MDEGPTIAKPEAWFGVIQAGARQHESTAEIWGRIHDYADANNLAIPSDMFSQVNRMRGIASDLTYSSERLGKASTSDAITGDMIGTQLYARTGADLADISQLYHVRFQMTTTSGGFESTGWYTLDYGGALPATVGELADDLDAYGQSLTEGYGVEYGGIGAIEIGAY